MNNSSIVKYETDGTEVQLSLATVKQYLVNGGNVTDQEAMMFMKLCQAQKLNPFTREAYLVKYGNQSANIIVGKDAFTRRAEANPNYKGFKGGIIVVNLKKDVEMREGTFYLKGKEELVGGWARVMFKDGKEDLLNTVSLDEYDTKKSLWSSKPATMIRKVALVQALREAFPNVLSQMYTAEEVGVDEAELPKNKVDIKEEQRMQMHIDEPPKMATKASKSQVMQLAHEKELMVGEGKEANIEALEKFANDNGISLRGMTEEQAQHLIKLLLEYQPIKDIPQEEITSVENETPTVEAEIVNQENNEESNIEEDEENPF